MKQENIKKFSLIILLSAILLVIRISYRGFLNYQETIITQQRKHLMTISKSVGRSIELYVDEKKKSLKELANNLENNLEKKENETIVEKLRRFYVDQEKEMSSIIYIDFKDNLTQIYPENEEKKKYILNRENFITDLNYVKENKTSYVGTHYLDGENSFSFNIFVPVFAENIMMGVVLGQIRLENIDRLLVSPLKIGRDGYVVINGKKDSILMHPVKSQIGYNAINIRKEDYPALDYSEIEKLFKKQREEEEGYYIYTSYWWPQEKLKKVKKMNVYSRVYLSSEYWIISVVSSYEEISEPIKNYLYGSLGISIIILLILSWIIFLTLKMIKNKENYEMETKYLREINNSVEQLRKKDVELNHKRQLEMIGTLTGGIAHEFNNALTPIRGYSEMCLRELDPALNSYDYIEGIYRASNRAQEIISQIRVFMGDKNIKTKYSVCSINTILMEALNFIESILPSNIKIIKNINEECGNIYGNETQIHQVILNLCTNAHNAMKKQQNGILKVSLSKVNYRSEEWLKNKKSQNRDYIKITIEDNGCGIDSKILDKIFEPFFSEKLSENSSGLGLSIVSGIVNKHGGLIRVNSQKGEGSIFDVYLPKTEKKGAEIYDLDSSLEIKGKERVLIVDNDEEIALMLEKGLAELGYRTKSITDSEELLKKFNYIKDKFQIIITDLSMPKLNGVQLAKKIKEIKPNIKIILMTAYSEEPLEEYMKLKIIDSYLMKPVLPSEVSRVIRKLIKTDINNKMKR